MNYHSLCFDTFLCVLFVKSLFLLEFILCELGLFTGPFSSGRLVSDAEHLDAQHICHLGPDANGEVEVVDGEES